MQYYHWSHNYIDKLEDIKYIQDDFKPEGFWFSVNKEWLEWCKENGLFNSEDDYQYEIIFNSENIYKISSLQDLKNFRKRFPTKLNKNWIDWNEVSKEYDGIVVYNYRDIKNDLLPKFGKYIWFLGLDCSCGCIWNIKIITSFFIINKFKEM